MVRKRSPADKAAESPKTDDLKLINGIGPAVESRLHGVGIFTFAQLAAKLPADIAAAVLGIRGLTAESIKTQDWIGQARKLAAKSVSSEAQKDVEVPAFTEQVVTFTAPAESPTSTEHAPAETLSVESQKDTAPSIAVYHPAMFTVELLLDERNDVHSTHVLHVQSRREQTWAGWPKTELVDFLGQNTGVNVSSAEPVIAKVEEPVIAIAEESEHVPALVAESKPLTSEAAQSGLAGTLHLRDMKITGTESADPRRTLPQEQPFKVHLTLDLAEMIVPGDTPLKYKASIYGKRRGSRSGQVVGEVEGTIKPTETTVTIDVDGNPLPEGTYRLAATVVLISPDTETAEKRGALAVMNGGRVLVF